MLKHGILGLLNYAEMTGYEIMTVFRDSLKFFWNAKTSQIYRELHNLNEKGWATKTVVRQSAKPDKNIYSLTDAGRAELLNWLCNGDFGLAANTPLLMKVFFLGEMDTCFSINYFEEIKKYCEMILNSFNEVPQNISSYAGMLENGEKSKYWQMTLDYGIRSLKMQIEWADDCIKILKGEVNK